MAQQDVHRLLDQAHRYAIEYIDGVRDRPVFPTEADLNGLAVFDEPLPRDGFDAAEALELLHRHGAPATTAQTGGRYFGFVNGGVYPGALAARWLADTWDQNAALNVISPVASKLEEICEKWLVDLFGLPEGTAAGFVSGTSVSLLCALAAARNELLRRLDWDAVGRGLFGAPEINVVVGAQAHGTVHKALSFLGLGRDRVHVVPCDEQGRMQAESLPALDAQTLLILAAGNVNTGAFDEFSPLCRAARSAGAWVHVDGAFGLWAGASPATAELCVGAGQADSWSVDAHKTLNAPYDCGVVLCKDRSALVSAMQAAGSYIQWSEQRDGMLYTPEMSRRARSIELWLLLKTLGRAGVAALVEQLCERARLFETLLKAEGFRVLNEVVFNQVLVACERPKLTEATLVRIQASGECWCGGSQWQGEPVIRVSVCSHATTEQDVERSVRAFVQARAEAAALPQGEPGAG